MRIIKRICSIFVVTMLMVFAFSYGATKTVKAEGNVCKIVRTGVEYTTLGYAINAAQNGDTIQMIADYSRDSNLSVTKNITIDFDDYVLSFGSSGYFEFSTGYEDVTLTLRTSGTGGVNNASGKMFQFNYNINAPFNNIITIESGSYTLFHAYSYAKNKWLSDNESGIPEHFVINGGTFTFNSDAIRNNFRESIAVNRLVSSSDSPSRMLDIKPKDYIEDEDTNASAKISYTDGYSVYRKVTSLSASDAGKKYILAYVNRSEDNIYIMKNYSQASYKVMYTDKHSLVNSTNDGTWYINSDSEFLGNVNEDFFVELGWDGNGYTFTVNTNDANPSNDYCLFYNKTNGHQFEPKDNSYKSDANYIYKFGFNATYYYFYPIGDNSTCIAYTPNLTYANYIQVTNTSYESGIGENHTVRVHLFEKVDIDPVVSTASIRFGKCITKDMYDYLSGCGTSVSFGVIAKKTADLGGAELTVSNASMNRTITPVRVSSAGATEEDLEGNFYQFALVLSGITSSNFETSITARCFVCIDGDYYYFNPSEYSLKTLADAYYNAVDTSAYTDHLPVLGYLKDYGG